MKPPNANQKWTKDCSLLPKKPWRLKWLKCAASWRKSLNVISQRSRQEASTSDSMIIRIANVLQLSSNRNQRNNFMISRYLRIIIAVFELPCLGSTVQKLKLVKSNPICYLFFWTNKTSNQQSSKKTNQLFSLIFEDFQVLVILKVHDRATSLDFSFKAYKNSDTKKQFPVKNIPFFREIARRRVFLIWRPIQ